MEEDKIKIIKDYMRELAYRSVEAQRDNTTKMSEMGKKGASARWANVRKKAEEDVVVSFK